MIYPFRLPAVLMMILLASACSRPADVKEADSQKAASQKAASQEAASQEAGNHEVVHTSDTDPQWIFSKTSGSTLQFTNGKGVNTKLSDLQYIGQLGNGNKAPYLVYAGRPCSDCDSVEAQIYIYSPDQPPSEKRVRYAFPGTFEANGRLSSRSRAFLGQILNDREGLIYYQEQLLKNNASQKTAFSVRVENGRLKHTLQRDTESIRETLRLLKEGKCIEIEGKKVSLTIP